MSACAVFYKKDKFNVVRSRYEVFAPGESQFYMHVMFSLKKDDSFKFIFGETHLKAKPVNMEQRSKQVDAMEWQTQLIDTGEPDKYGDQIPIFMAGDFNEEPQNTPIA